MKTKFIFLCLLVLLVGVNSYAQTETQNQSRDQETIQDWLAPLLNFRQPQFLAVDEAFQLKINSQNAQRAVAEFKIADGYYIYRDKINFKSSNAAVAVELPAAEIIRDEYFGETAVFKNDFVAIIHLPPTREFNLTATYQGCAEAGICYAPVVRNFKMDKIGFNTTFGEQPNGLKNPELIPPPALLFSAFIGGLLLTFTPCVLPMLPILFALVAQRKRKPPAVVAFVSGTLVTYAAVGAVAGSSGAQLQSYFQTPLAIGILAAILLMMAAAQFGWFALQTPAFLQNFITRKTATANRSLFAIFTLGIISSLIVGACVSPLLISFLGLAIASGDAGMGALLMAAMALGMGIPMLVLGFGASAILPRVGAWMEYVNRVLGLGLVALAIYLLGSLAVVPVLILWGIFIIACGIYLGWLILRSDMLFWRGFATAAVLILIICGGITIKYGVQGHRNLFLAVQKTFSDDFEKAMPKDFISVDSLDGLDNEFARAADENKFVLVEYYADWCGDCIRLQRTTFAAPRVAKMLRENFIMIRIDLTDPFDKNAIALKKKFGVFGPPAVLFFNQNGETFLNKNFYGYKNPSDFFELISTL